jgi:hypothetical protein
MTSYLISQKLPSTISCKSRQRKIMPHSQPDQEENRVGDTTIIIAPSPNERGSAIIVAKKVIK